MDYPEILAGIYGVLKLRHCGQNYYVSENGLGEIYICAEIVLWVGRPS